MRQALLDVGYALLIAFPGIFVSQPARPAPELDGPGVEASADTAQLQQLAIAQPGAFER